MTVSVNFVPEMKPSEAVDTTAVAGLVQGIRRAQIELGEEVVVVGDGPRARLAADLAGIAGALSVRLVAPPALDDVPEKCADVVLYAAGEARWLGQALRITRNLGRVVLLDAVGAVDFDVYPDVHKRSIRLIGARLPEEPSSQATEFVQYLRQFGRLYLSA